MSDYLPAAGQHVTFRVELGDHHGFRVREGRLLVWFDATREGCMQYIQKRRLGTVWAWKDKL